MDVLNDLLYDIERFGQLGGPVLWFIGGLMLLIWLLLIERLLYYVLALPSEITALERQWRERPLSDGRHHRKRREQIRLALLSPVRARIDTSLPLIRTLVALAPLLGLLGTVTGMVGVFDALNVAEAGGARAMSSGVSRATIPTMAGMVVALSGILGLGAVDRLATKARARLDNSLAVD